MKKLINKIFLKYLLKIQKWAKQHSLGLFLFNIITLILLLLRSAGYFEPFLPLTINLIVLISFILAIFLLGATKQSLFFITLIFWLFSAILKILQIDIWAERTVIYSFQALVIGIVMLFFENKK